MMLRNGFRPQSGGLIWACLLLGCGGMGGGAEQSITSVSNSTITYLGN